MNKAQKELYQLTAFVKGAFQMVEFLASEVDRSKELEIKVVLFKGHAKIRFMWCQWKNEYFLEPTHEHTIRWKKTEANSLLLEMINEAYDEIEKEPFNYDYCPDEQMREEQTDIQHEIRNNK